MARALRRRVAARLKRGSGRPAEPPRKPAPSVAERAAMSDVDRPIIERAFPYTMTGAARLQGLVDAVRYLERSGVPGAFAECGVWRGGSVLAMLLTLQDEGSQERDVYLYDTFEGMTQPTEDDVSRLEQPALETWRSAEAQGEQAWGWLLGDFDEDSVRETVLSSGYPEAGLHFVRGPVEQTIPGTAPEQLALLRLDTDWYESTRHELEHL